MPQRKKVGASSKRRIDKRSRAVRDVAPRTVAAGDAGPVRGGAGEVGAKMTMKIKPEYTRHK